MGRVVLAESPEAPPPTGAAMCAFQLALRMRRRLVTSTRMPPSTIRIGDESAGYDETVIGSARTDLRALN